MRKMRRTAVFGTLLASLLLVSCEKERIIDWSDPEKALETAKVGVVVGWAQDFWYEDQGKPCLRFQDGPDGILALEKGDIDAFYYGYDLALQAVEMTKRLRILDYGKRLDHQGILCRSDDTELFSQLNEFIAKVKDDPVWQEVQYAYLHDQRNPADITPVEVPKEGKVLRVGYEDENYPITYYLPSGEVTGYSVTILNLFARDYGYRLEFESGTWNSNLLSLKNKKIDCILDFFSEQYMELMESTGDFRQTDSYLAYYMVYLIRNDDNAE